MKKIITRVLSLVLVFALLSLTACGKTPYEVINGAVERTEELNSYEAVITNTYEIDMGITKIEMPMVIEMKATNLRGENPKIYSKVSVTVSGITSVAETYIEGDWAYVIQGDTKFKLNLERVSDSLEVQYDYTDFVDSMLEDLPPSLFENVTLEKTDDGSKTVALDIPDTLFKEIFDDLLETNSTILENLTDSVGSAVVSEAKLSLSVNGSYVNRYSVEYKVTLPIILGTSISAKITSVCEIKNHGGNISISYPDGYKSFADYT